MIRSSMRRYHTYPAKGALCGPVGTHRVPIGALCEGSSMQLYSALYGRLLSLGSQYMRRYHTYPAKGPVGTHRVI